MGMDGFGARPVTRSARSRSWARHEDQEAESAEIGLENLASASAPHSSSSMEH